MKQFVVAIDGFSGVGKSTVARKTATRLSVPHLNSGFIFRAIALKILKNGLKTSHLGDVSKILSETALELTQVPNNTGGLHFEVVLDGVVLGEELQEENIGKGASEVAKFLDVRDFACRLQRRMAEKSSIVVEGRDAGTVIFPDARFKFFLTASTKVSAKRRLLQLRPDMVEMLENPGTEKFLEQFKKEVEQVEAELTARDQEDASREIAPTVKADDAIQIDTSELSADEVVERIVQIVNNQLQS